MRQPGMMYVFDSEVNSTVTSIAPGHLQHRRRRIVVEIDLGIGEVGQDDQLVLLRERDRVLIEVEARRPYAVGFDG